MARIPSFFLYVADPDGGAIVVDSVDCLTSAGCGERTLPFEREGSTEVVNGSLGRTCW
jgi:hypothetical protein